MLNPFHFTGKQKYNGIVPVTNCIALYPSIAVTINDNSRLNRAGFFMSITDQRYTSVEQHIEIRVSGYKAISLLRNAANSATKKLKKT